MHKHYLFYTSEGEPTFILVGTEEDAILQLDNDLNYDFIECTIDSKLINHYKIVNGEPVLKSDEEILTPTFRNRKIEDVKNIASGAILFKYPLWKQNNMIARAVELQNNLINSFNQSEQDEFDLLQSKWDEVKAIRNLSDIACNAILSATSLNEIDTIIQGFEYDTNSIN